LIFPSGMEVEGEVKLKATETPTERTHRHKMEVREFWVKEAPVHLTAIGIVVCGTGLSLYLTFRPGSSLEEKQWSFSVLSHLLIAVAGFAFGKAAK
jgi:hypothetical protein